MPVKLSCRGCICLAALVALAWFSGSSLRAEDDVKQQAEVKRLIGQLDDEKFLVRQQAHERLLKIGLPALSQVTLETESPSPERRYRARQIVLQIQHRWLSAEFTKLARRKDDKIDLEESMWLISRIVNPQARRADLEKPLDEMAQRVRKRLGDDVDPTQADPQKVVAALRHVLFVEYQLTGNAADYDNPDNSSLERVLATRKGLPILLSHIVVSVGDRLKVPLVGLPLPGRYMVKYDGTAAPKGFARDDIILNPFGGGEILTVKDLTETIRGFNPQVHLIPSTNREIVIRMLVNLASDYDDVRKPKQAELVRHFQHLLESEDPEKN